MDGLEQHLPNNLNKYLRIKQKKKSNKKMSWSSVLTSALKSAFIFQQIKQNFITFILKDQNNRLNCKNLQYFKNYMYSFECIIKSI